VMCKGLTTVADEVPFRFCPGRLRLRIEWY
jgi:hypothetical protein